MSPGWHPVALSADIERGTSAGTRADRAELLVWRDESGQAHVWEDRCPHRGMRLSFGFVRGSQLACLYHGWQFDGAGRCRLIPAHPLLRVPSTIRATPYASVERLGIIWVCIGAPNAAPPDDAEAVGVRSLDLRLDATFVLTGLPQWPPPLENHGEQRRHGPLVIFGSGAMRLAVAVQALAPDQAMLHLSLLGRPEPSLLIAISNWAEDLRDRLEQPA